MIKDIIKDMVKSFQFSDDDSHEFLPILSEIEEEPVNPAGHIIFWLIISVIFFTLLWLIFAKVDIVVSARGKIIPDGEIKILQPLETGTVKQILIKEGDFVKKGQVMMEIDPSTTEPELESLKENLDYLSIESQRLNAVSSGTGMNIQEGSDPESVRVQQKLYRESMQELNDQLQAKRLEAKGIDEQIKSATVEKVNYRKLLSLASDRQMRLYNVSDLVSKDDIQKAEADVSNYRSHISELDCKLQELRHQKSQIIQETGYIRASFRARNLTELADNQKKSTEIQANIREITYRNQQQKIVAPVDGYVNTLFIHTVGGVVTPAEKLVSVVPYNSPLLVKATVLNKDIGFVRENMPVSVKVDTFDFQKYGIIHGVVKKVSKDSIEHPKLGPIYDVYIIPLEKTLIVEGRPTSISTGMGVNAEIKVGKRRVIEFFIYPMIKYWNQAITVR